MSLAASAAGGFAGPWLLRRMLDTWSRPVYSVVLLLFCLPLGVLGAAMYAAAFLDLDDVPDWVVTISAACGWLLLTSVAMVAAAVLCRWWWRGRREAGL